MTNKIDGVTVEVVRNYLGATAQEMRATLIRTAFNPVIYEVLDFGISMYDRNLDLIAEAPGLTMFLGANDYSVRKVVGYMGKASFEDGDVAISNYPYWNAAHTYDATLLAPVFADGGNKPFGYLCVRAHWIDLGAKDPGYVLDSTDMHQEGLVFPGTKIIKRGNLDREILEIIRFNSRMPDIVTGDFNAMVAALRTGERRLKEIVAKFGETTMDDAIASIFDHGERATAKALARLPKGTWSAEDIIDDDGISNTPIKMKASVTIDDDAFIVDFAGSAGTQRGPVNMPFGSTIAMCKVVFKALTTPAEPSNAGHSRALDVRAEPGNLFHAEYPAPTFTLWTGIVGLELLFKAIAQAMPDQLPASSGGDVPGFMMLGTHPDTGKFFALSNNDPVGWGASAQHDGANALLHLSESIVRNTPIEVLESNTTMFFERYELRADSGGAGKFRGGLGLRRDIRFLSDGEFLTVMKKTKSRPWALAGGLEPEANSVIAFAGTEREMRMSTKRVPVKKGDRVTVLTAGGGGHGDPKARDPKLVEADLAGGLITPEAARDIFGWTAGAED
jgi:N-methylhydantoinase B